MNTTDETFPTDSSYDYLGVIAITFIVYVFMVFWYKERLKYKASWLRKK